MATTTHNKRWYPTHEVGKPVAPEQLNRHLRLAFDGVYDINTALANLPQTKYLTITGVQDGVNKIYRLSSVPKVLLWFRNGVLQAPGGADYTLLGGQVTTVVAPLVGDKLIALGG